MYIDALQLLSDAQAFTTDTASTNTIDLGNVTPRREIGTGEPLCLAIAVDVYATPTGTDYEFRFIQSEAADLSNPDILCSVTYTGASLAAGDVRYLPIPPGSVSKRYVGAYFNNVTGTTTVTATIVLGPQSMIQSWRVYAKGYRVS